MGSKLNMETKGKATCACGKCDIKMKYISREDAIKIVTEWIHIATKEDNAPLLEDMIELHRYIYSNGV